MATSLTYNVDCMEYMRTLPDKAFDLCIADPPYGISIQGGFGRRKNDLVCIKYNTFAPWDKERISKSCIDEMLRVAKNQIIFGAQYYTDMLPVSKSWIIWDKNYNTNDLTFNQAELAWTSTGKPIKIFTKSNNESFSKKIHLTQKPVELYKWLLSKYAKPGDKIFDPYLGSGSSRIAAYDLGFDFVGCEIDKVYFDLEEKRFEEHTKQIRFDMT